MNLLQMNKREYMQFSEYILYAYLQCASNPPSFIKAVKVFLQCQCAPHVVERYDVTFRKSAE